MPTTYMHSLTAPRFLSAPCAAGLFPNIHFLLASNATQTPHEPIQKRGNTNPARTHNQRVPRREFGRYHFVVCVPKFVRFFFLVDSCSRRLVGRERVASEAFHVLAPLESLLVKELDLDFIFIYFV
jgi:hypothetical protein